MRPPPLPDGLTPERLAALRVEYTHGRTLDRPGADEHIVKVWNEMLARVRGSASELASMVQRLEEEIEETRPTGRLDGIADSYAAAADAADACASRFGADVTVLECLRPWRALDEIELYWEVSCARSPVTERGYHFSLWVRHANGRVSRRQGESVSERETWGEAATRSRKSAIDYREIARNNLAEWSAKALRASVGDAVRRLSDRGELAPTDEPILRRRGRTVWPLFDSTIKRVLGEIRDEGLSRADQAARVAAALDEAHGDQIRSMGSKPERFDTNRLNEAEKRIWSR